LLLSLPACRDGGLATIAAGLFAESEDVKRLTIEILFRLERTTVGRQAVSKLNYFLKLKYVAYKQQREA